MSDKSNFKVPHLLYTSAKTQSKAGQQITSLSPSGISDQDRLKILYYSFGVNPYRNVLCRIDVTDTIYCYQLDEDRVAIGRLMDAGRNYDGRPGRTQTHTIVLSDSEFEAIGFDPLLLNAAEVFTRNDFAAADFTNFVLATLKTKAIVEQTAIQYLKQKFSLNLIQKIITGILSGKTIIVLYKDTQPLTELQTLYKIIPKSVRCLIRLATFFYDPFLQTNPYNTLSKPDFNLIFAPRSCVKSAKMMANTIILDSNGNKIVGEEDITLDNYLANSIIKYLESNSLEDLLSLNTSLDKVVLKYRKTLPKDRFRVKVSDMAKTLESRQIIEKLLVLVETTPSLEYYSRLFEELENYQAIIIANKFDDEIKWYNSSYNKTVTGALNFDGHHFISQLPIYFDFLLKAPFGIALESAKIQEKQLDIIAKSLSNAYNLHAENEKLEKLSHELFRIFFAYVYSGVDGRQDELELLFNKIEESNYSTRIKTDITVFTKEKLYPLAQKSPNQLPKVINLLFSLANLTTVKYEAMNLYFIALSSSLEYYNKLAKINNHKNFIISHLDISNIELTLTRSKTIFANQNEELRMFYGELLYIIHTKYTSNPEIVSLVDKDLNILLDSLLSAARKSSNLDLINPILQITPKSEAYETIINKAKITLIGLPIRQGRKQTFFEEVSDYVKQEDNPVYLLEAWSEIITSFTQESKQSTIEWLKTNDWVKLLLLFYHNSKKNYAILADYKTLLEKKNCTKFRIYTLFRSLENSLDDKGLVLFNQINTDIFWTYLDKELDSKYTQLYKENMIKQLSIISKETKIYCAFIEKIANVKKLNDSALTNYLTLYFSLFRLIAESKNSEIIKDVSFVHAVTDFLMEYNKELANLYSNKSRAEILNIVITKTLNLLHNEGQKYNTLLKKRRELVFSLFDLHSNIKVDLIADSSNIIGIYNNLVTSINRKNFLMVYKDDILKLLSKANKNNPMLSKVFYNTILNLGDIDIKHLNISYYEEVLDSYLKSATRNDFDDYNFIKVLSFNIRLLRGSKKITREGYLLYMKRIFTIISTKKCPQNISYEISSKLKNQLISIIESDRVDSNSKKIAADIERQVSKYLKKFDGKIKKR